ncbi:MAG: hypothetical protein QM619_07540 [Micropruina sp.]|uniref:hypothetical protein n=1 Tax=Micropruina sp. TaxID=2737536 RepID=UPI0039E52F9A
MGAKCRGEDAAHTRWSVGGTDFRDTMYGMSWIPAGVDYVTDLAEPARSELREPLHRMLRALDASPPRSANVRAGRLPAST